MLHVRRDEADELLELAEDASCWLLGPVDGSFLIRIPAPEPLRGAQINLVKLLPGTALPASRATAHEELLVMQGALREATGTETREGERVARTGLSRPHAVAVGEKPCVCCVVSHPAQRSAGGSA